MAKPDKNKKWLIFIDTNVLLDFYRLGGEDANRQLALLERHKDSIILNDQVHMEFLKNRQKVILDNLKQFEKPKSPSAPPILTDAQAFRALKSQMSDVHRKFNTVKSKLENILSSPSSHDNVFKSINRLYEHNSVFNIKRPNKIRFEIRMLAAKRFFLGHPPRKKEDTSFGDAINWETIIHCANLSKDNHNILIVSRDSDYGITHDNNAIINDWLRREFKERVSRKRDIFLTNKLTYALKFIDETVTAADEKAEQEILKPLPLQFTSNDT